MSGVKGRSGRKRSISTLVNEALERVDERIPELFNKLVKKALEGDRECLIYLIDRRLGKPKQQADVDISGGGEIGKGVVIEILKAIHAERRKELESGEPALLKEGEG